MPQLSDADLLRALQRKTFHYFLRYTNAKTGLVQDNSRQDSPSSITAVGLALAAYAVGVEQGYLTRAEAVQKTLITLRFFWHSPQGPEPDATGYQGFYYHFLDMETGRRTPNAELSTIDTTFLLAGALAAAQYFDHNTAEEIARSLEGTYRPEHLFALQQAVALYDFYTQQLIACDAEIEQLYAVFEPKVDLLELPLPAKKKQKRSNDPAYDLRSYLYQLCGVDLTAVDGIDVVLAQDILAEIGTDMSKWPTAKHFTSWLGLAPKNDVSGGKVLRRGTQPVKARANRAFRLAAQTVNRRESALGAFYRRIRTKHGAPVAITATARKMATIVYQMLKQHRPYEDPGAVHYEARYKQRLLRNLNRTAKRLGMQLVPAESTYVS
jgi:transposase